MPLPTGNATFPGISTIIAAQMTLSHGISPSSAIITTVPHTNFVAKVGDLKFFFGGETITFKDAIADRATFTQSGAGQRWTLRIFDRRWKWRFGAISGRYNARETNGLLRKDLGNEKTPRELALILLDAMSETRVDVSDIPNTERIFVNWDHVNPAAELANLCDQLGCRIILGIDDKVYITRIGNGRPLPENGLQMNRSFAFDTKIRPESIVIIGGPTLFQSFLDLEAIGEDTDGSIQLLDDLSYKPVAGWSSQVPGLFAGVNEDDRPLAKKTVWRWYRVKKDKTKIPGSTSSIDGIYDINGKIAITLQTTRIAVQTNLRGTVVPDATASGVFWVGGDKGGNEAEITEEFSIDAENGIVKFPDYMWRASDIDSSTGDASLFLGTSFTHTEFESGRPDAAEYTQRVAGPRLGAGVRIERRPELFLTVDNTSGKVITNGKEFREQAQRAATEVAKEYDVSIASDLQYAGLIRLQPDGAIQQISWQVGGGAPTTTRASRNVEFDRFTPSFDARRNRERSNSTDTKVQGFVTGDPTSAK